MNRRKFLAANLGAVCAMHPLRSLVANPRPPFTLDYAAHFGMFKNSAPGGLLDELRFA